MSPIWGKALGPNAVPPQGVDGEAPPTVDHPYVPRAEWWSLCKACGLAEAAHPSSARPNVSRVETLRTGW
jgi:hypothetical protein